MEGLLSMWPTPSSLQKGHVYVISLFDDSISLSSFLLIAIMASKSEDRQSEGVLETVRMSVDGSYNVSAILVIFLGINRGSAQEVSTDVHP